MPETSGRRRRRRGTWIRLVIGSWNFGPGTLADLATLMGIVSVLAVQEAGDRARLIAQALAEHAGWAEITGPEPGQSSTPMLYDGGRHELLEPLRYLIAERQDVGPGAGPDTMKQKWMIGGKFRDLQTGRKFRAFCVHYVATQGKPRRHQVAVNMSRSIAFHVRHAVLATFVMGDTNALPNSAVLRVLRDAGLSLTQLVDEILGTHGRRAIDQILWTARWWIRFVRQYVVATRSDHKALIGEFDLRTRSRWLRRHGHAAAA